MRLGARVRPGRRRLMLAALVAAVMLGLGVDAARADGLSFLRAAPSARQQTTGSTGEPPRQVSPLTDARQADPEPQELELFSRQDCPQCARARAYLAELQAERPNLRVTISDVAQDPTALGRLQQAASSAGVTSVAVPAFYVRGQLIVGWGGREVTGRQVESLLDGAAHEAGSAAGEGCAVDLEEAACAPPPVRDAVEVPVVGQVSARSLGLPAFTAVVGLLDGFNPCAMWTLLLLLSLLVHLRSRLRMLLVAGTFILVSGLVYFAFMAAWLNVFLLVGLSRGVQLGLGGVALLVGLVNLKDVVAFKRGVSFSIPDPIKPRIYTRISRVIHAPSIPAMLGGVAILAVLVNGVELLCTAGLPAVYTQVLTGHDLPGWQYYAYLGLYQVFYMLDDSLMLVVAVWTLSLRRLQEREGRWLKLVSGAVLAGLGAALLFRPDLLHW